MYLIKFHNTIINNKINKKNKQYYYRKNNNNRKIYEEKYLKNINQDVKKEFKLFSFYR